MDSFLDLAISISCHVLTSLWILVVSILSYWTNYRVNLATSDLPLDDELEAITTPGPPAFTSPWSSDFKRRDSWNPATGGNNILDLGSPLASPIILRRGSSCSALKSNAKSSTHFELYDSGSESGSDLGGNESGSQSSGGGGMRRISNPIISPNSANHGNSNGNNVPSSPQYLGALGRSGSLGAIAMANRLNSSNNNNSYWLDSDNEKSPTSSINNHIIPQPPMSPMTISFSTYPMETPDVNSVTGAEFPLLGSKEMGGRSLLSETEFKEAAKRNARYILCMLAVLRTFSTVPLVFMEAAAVDASTTNWTLFISTFDLVLLDLFIAALLAIAPVFCIIFSRSFDLPKSFEHHVYYLSLILLVLPPLSTLQLNTLSSTSLTHLTTLFPNLTIPSMHRIICPLISAVMLLIAREQAGGEYWKPMERKRWTRFAN